MEASQSGDTDVMVALAAVLLERAGLQVNMAILWGAMPDAFDVKGDPSMEDEDRPPVSATPGGNASAPGVEPKPNANPGSAGLSGSANGDEPTVTPQPSGAPGSAPTSTFGQATLPS